MTLLLCDDASDLETDLDGVGEEAYGCALGVDLEKLDDRIECVGEVDLGRHSVVIDLHDVVGRDGGFGEKSESRAPVVGVLLEVLDG